MSVEPGANSKGQPLITMRGVSKTYVNAAGAFVALEDVNLTFFEGEFVGVIGKSGSGKSTLVNMITGIDRPTAGQVLIDGVDMHAMRESRQARWRGLNLGVVFQFFQLLPMLSLLENVLLPMDFCNKYDNGERIKRAMSLLEMMGLADDAHKLPGAVSGGQQQSAAIARAMANDPPIIVADEPTGNLDARTADSVYDKFEALASQGRTIIMITHDPEIEHRLSRTVLISDGRVIDPLLAQGLPWIPHPVLRELTVALNRFELNQGDGIPEPDSARLVLVEEGRVEMTFPTGSSAVFEPGQIFAIGSSIGESLSGEVASQIVSESASLAWLSWPFLTQTLQDASVDMDRLRSEVRRQMHGKDLESNEMEGLIR